VHDTWIAATAFAHGAEVWTQNADLSTFGAVEVVRVQDASVASCR
jgi:predicted nucleic acid-binding protein